MSEPQGSTRVVHVTSVPVTLGFFRGHVGYLGSRGYTVTAISSPGPGLDEFGATAGVGVRAVSIARRISPFRDLLSLLGLCLALARLRPHIVHCTTPKAGLLGTVAARLVGARTVLSVFGLPQMTRTGVLRTLLDATTRLSCQLAHRVWCDSHSVRDHLVAERLCSRDKVFVAGGGSSCGVDAATFDRRLGDAPKARRELAIPEPAFVVGFVGRLVRDKGIHELAMAWQVLRRRHPEMHLLLVGPPEAADPIAGEVDRFLRADPRVHFTGPRRDVARLLAAMDVFAMPSYREGFPVANLEAAALSLPVVATRVPGCIDSVVDGETGTLVPPRDPLALAAAIERYVADPALRAAHGAAGRARVLAEFQPARIWSDVAAVYEQLLADRARRSPPPTSARATGHIPCGTCGLT